MAIIENLGLEVKILVNGTQAAEYQGGDFSETDDDFGADTALCHRYIESIDNAEFAIEFGITARNAWLQKSSKQILLCCLDVDDQKSVTEGHIRKHEPEIVLEGVYGYSSNAYFLRRFKFAPVSISDDANDTKVEDDEKRAQYLGLIRVCIYRATLTHMSRGGLRYGGDLEMVKEKQSLAERALKGNALSHVMELFPAVTTEDVATFNYLHKDPKDKPLAVFYFKYRSKATLQQQMIIPRPRSPTPPSLDRGSLPQLVPHLLGGELLESLPFDEVLRLAQQGLSGTGRPLDSLSVTEVRRLAGQALDDLPLREVRRLAKQIPSANDLAANTKRQPDEALASERLFKYVKTEGPREAIDFTDD